MKKSFLITTLLILTINFSCQEQENTVEPQVDFEEASTFLSDMFSQTLKHSVSNAKFDARNGKVEFSNSDVIGKYLQQNYFPDLETLEYFFDTQPNARTSENESHFTEEQQVFINDLDHVMTNLTSAEEFYSSVEEFRNRIVTEVNMSDEQKFEMLAMVEYSYALHEYLIRGGISEIKKVLPELDNSNGRVSRVTQERPNYEVLECDDKENADCSTKDGEDGGCSVDWRNVWAGAVVGLVAYGIQGAIVGCGGGTVALPIIGTAGGCVGGAVFGGASGFIAGTLTGIAAELLTSCGR